MFSLGHAHPGGLDANGGHNNRKTGEYHYHQKKTVPHLSAPTPNNVERISRALKEERLNEYFREANENVGALSCGLLIVERDVSRSIKERVLRRDDL